MTIVKTIAFLLTGFAEIVYGMEFCPVSVFLKGEASVEHPVSKMIDGNPSTFATLLDTTCTGNEEKTVPPKGSHPVTTTFVLDAGAERTVCGIRFVATPSRWLASMAYSVTVFSCADAEGKTGFRVLATKAVLPVLFCGESGFVEWPATRCRFIGVEVHESCETALRYLSTYYGWITAKGPKMWGHPVTGMRNQFATEIAEVSLFDARPSDFPQANTVDTAYPEGRLLKDWLMQDAGVDHFTELFTSAVDAEKEKHLLAQVSKELGVAPPAGPEGCPGKDPRWKELYLRLCRARRAKRLRTVVEKAPRVVYTKHYTMGGNAEASGTSSQTDDLNDGRPMNWTKGGQLCLLTVKSDGTIAHEVLLDRPEGCIRDPAVSPDGKTVVFSMREAYSTNAFYLPRRFSDQFRKPAPWKYAVEKRCGDDFHLYRMDLTTRALTQLTFDTVLEGKDVESFWRHTPGSSFTASNALPPHLRKRLVLPCSDYEPCFAPDGKIIFESTRCEEVIPCHQTLLPNLYSCNPDGSGIRRIAFDGASSFHPSTLDDGRILYTRYEYNDRNARFQQPLFTMNPDGTAQTEYYGNNSFYPASLHHFRAIPGTGKIIGIVGGHHIAQKGKLIVIDRRKGTQGDSGIMFMAGSSIEEEPGCVPSHYEKDPRICRRDPDVNDFFGQFGPQWQHPYPLNETEWLTGFLPEGNLRGRFGSDPNFGVYWQNAAGARELLAYDPSIECSQPVPVTSRTQPSARRSLIDWKKSFGRFYIQNVYVGPGLKGIPKGTVKKLRVAAVEARPMYLHTGRMDTFCDPAFAPYIRYGGDQSGEAITAGGAWDIKHVLGEVDVEPDGSCAFFCPANNAVYFQLLDERGRCVQTMRSWTMVAPGEESACVGCHEDKMQVYPAKKGLSSARVQRIQPAPGQPPHPLMTRLEKEGLLASPANYLGVDAPRSSDPDAPTEGFSFLRCIQPILNKHCVACHDGTERCKGRPNLTGTWDKKYKSMASRKFSYAYTSLTAHGRQTPMLNWFSSTGISEMLPPGVQGSIASRIMFYLEPVHHGVWMSEEDKRLFACWIDLSIPFGGSYAEATVWSQEERKIFEYHQNKRAVFAEREILPLRMEKK